MSFLEDQANHENQSEIAEEKSVVLVYTADNNYEMPLTISVSSVLENLSSNYNMKLFIADDRITDSNKIIRKSLDHNLCQVELIPKLDIWLTAIQDILIYLNEATSIELKHITVSAVSFYRLFIAEFLPPTIDRVIYLDCDLIVKDDFRNHGKLILMKIMYL